MYCGHARLCVCLSAAVHPHYCTDPDVTWGRGRGCSLVVHYWTDLQSGHGLRCYGNNANPSYKLASILRYDDIVWTTAWAGYARAASRWLAGDGGVLKIARRIWEVGVAGLPVIGRRRAEFSTLLRRPWLQASTSGVLATKSERKMLASTCLYSLYAWLLFLDISSLLECL